MTGKAHFWISAILCQFIGIILFKDLSAVPFIIGAICGLVADIDEDQSKISYMLIRGFGGKKRIKDVNYHFTDVKHNSRIKLKRRIALSTVLIISALVLLFVFKLSIFFSLALLYISYLPWTTHRTLSHSITSTLIVGGLATLGAYQYGLAKYGMYIGIGYFLHIFEDMFTVSGVPLLYPFSKKKYKIPLMSTGTTKGSIVELSFILLSAALCIVTYITAFAS